MPTITTNLLCKLTAVAAFALVLSGAEPARAGATFYTDEAAWTAAVAAGVESLDTTATRVLEADEVAVLPLQDEALGPKLSWKKANTGLCASFALETLESGAGLTYEDGEPSPATFPADTLSIGDIDDFEDDDFRILFAPGSVRAVGFFLVNNTQDAGESFSAFGSAGLSLGTLEGASIPDSSGNGSTFLGVVASEPLTSVRFDEDASGDDIAIRDFRLACMPSGRLDTDVDGLSNLAEQAAGTDPNDSDSDDDGLLDGEELGTGSFGLIQIFAYPAAQTLSVVAADVDGDGDLDVLAGIGDLPNPQIAWFENMDGAGSFGLLQTISTEVVGTGDIRVIAADVDGDGDTDVLSASGEDDKIAWYENTDGAGSFGAQQVISTLADYPRSIAVADIDGDGDIDVVSASFYGREIAWYENLDGLGSFGAEQVISTDGGLTVLPADLDGDGDIDLLTSSSVLDDEIAWFENTDGAGSFGARQVISTLAEGHGWVFAADMDGDGDVDVLSGRRYSSSKIAWYENTDGAGNFGAQQEISTDGASYLLLAADVEGDGDVDVLTISGDVSTPWTSDDAVAWYENTGAEIFGPQQQIDHFIPSIYGGTPENPLFASLADLDGDGDLDILQSFVVSAFSWVEQINVSDPLDGDTDGDGVGDGIEVALGLDPSVPNDFPSGIDIKPGTAVNYVFPRSSLPIPVAILGSLSLDVDDVDVTTLAFGPSRAAPIGASLTLDVDGDGMPDLVSEYTTVEAGIDWGDERACLTGEMLNGDVFALCDVIRMPWACGLGFELVLLLPALQWLRRRRARPSGAI